MEWQPIAAAPKDETWVLLWLPAWGQGQARLGQWLGSPGSEGWYGREWKEVFHDGPTHWLPIPEPPRAS